MGWQFRDMRATPTEVAQLYIRERFESPRSILGGRVTAQPGWVGRRFEGWFRLEDGRKTYSVTCDESGLWTICG